MRTKARGMGAWSDYLLAELERPAARPTREEMLARLTAGGEVGSPPTA
jgi:hypothetical protein